MKAFEFKPKLFTTLQNYSKESFMADLMAGIIVGIVALPLAIAFGIASCFSRKRCNMHCPWQESGSHSLKRASP